MTKRRQLPPTFPHRLVLVLSIVLCLCSIASIGLAVLIWINELWGYYWATGFWTGVVIFFTGAVGIVCTFVRNLSSAKTFMIASIFGCLVSLGMVALSAGGLDYDSGFYNGFINNHYLTNICHGSSLALGTLQLAICMLNDGICVYYLFIEKNAEIYNVKKVPRRLRNRRHASGKDASNRASTRSDAPLIGESFKRNSSVRHGSSIRKERLPTFTELPDRPLSISETDALVCLRRGSQSDVRTPCARTSSFFTFGHGIAPERTSLIVQPGDGMSVAESNRSPTPSSQSDGECLYAQTSLFDPPLPIEEDDELPPYERVDSHPYENLINRPRSEQIRLQNPPVRRVKSLPARGRRRDKANRNSLTRSQFPPGRMESPTPEADVFYPRTLDEFEYARRRLSSSGEIIRGSYERINREYPGIHRRDFSRSQERVAIPDDMLRFRSQSLRIDKERRLERRKRALSAELKLTKEQILAGGAVDDSWCNRATSDASNWGMFAGNRVLPTRYSLRTPVRRIGMPVVRSAVPVKAITTVPMFSPPPKPPRTHSITLEDLSKEDLRMSGNSDAFTDQLTEAIKRRKQGSKVLHQEENIEAKEIKGEQRTIDLAQSKKEEEMKVASGPVLQMQKPPRPPPLQKVEKKDDKPVVVVKIPPPQIIPSTETKEPASMTLPTSPVLKAPPMVATVTLESKTVKSEAKVNVLDKPDGRSNQTLTKLESEKKTEKSNSGKGDKNDKTVEVEHSFEDSVTISFGKKVVAPKPMNSEKDQTRATVQDQLKNLQNLSVQFPPASVSISSSNSKDSVVDNKQTNGKPPNTPSTETGARPKTFKKPSPSAKPIRTSSDREKLRFIYGHDNKISSQRSQSNHGVQLLRTNSKPEESNPVQNSPKSPTSRIPATVHSSDNSSKSKIFTQASSSVQVQPKMGVQSASSKSVHHTPLKSTPSTGQSTNTATYRPNGAIANTVTTTLLSSQGVHHIPQSQYSRQVADNAPAAPPVDINMPARGDNENSEEKPLFSMLL